MSVLVVGGAGYIGSHMVKTLRESGRGAGVLDDLSTGYRDAVAGGFVEGPLEDRETVHRALDQFAATAAMHFASFIQVGESVTSPAKYYANNVAGTIGLLNALCERGVKRFIFSSSAAVYGEPRTSPIPESHATQPLNPYGRTKLMVEDLLPDYERAYGLKWVALRYFNAAGAHPDESLGERHEPETHLIPLALRAANGRLPHLTVFGADYPTPDGTCIRDYVHVCDLADAHLLALDYLDRGGESRAFNLGNGGGFSVKQVIESVERVTGRQVPVSHGPRRAGDPAVLVADATLARSTLGWQPRYADLDTIVAHAWAWERKSSPDAGKT
jgi:UDP-glucose 4-epimerase